MRYAYISRTTQQTCISRFSIAYWRWTSGFPICSVNLWKTLFCPSDEDAFCGQRNSVSEVRPRAEDKTFSMVSPKRLRTRCLCPVSRTRSSSSLHSSRAKGIQIYLHVVCFKYGICEERIEPYFVSNVLAPPSYSAMAGSCTSKTYPDRHKRTPDAIV